jgi:hypothetical protein
MEAGFFINRTPNPSIEERTGVREGIEKAGIHGKDKTSPPPRRFR